MNEATHASLAPQEELQRLWQSGQRPDLAAFLAGRQLSAAALQDVVRLDQQLRWRAGEIVPAEAYLDAYPTLRADSERAVELVYGEYLLRQEQGDTAALPALRQRFPQFAERLNLQVELHQALNADPQADGMVTPTLEMPINAPRRTLRRSTGEWPTLPGYEVVGELGRGGMGVVYQAWQTRLNRMVALKMVLAGKSADSNARTRFLVEAEAAARLQHPNIVQVYEVGEQDDMPFMALEFVDGGSLAQRLKREPLLARDAVVLLETLARAVHHAHHKGIVHRDLKPGNVLLTTDGAPKIADFGLAKLVIGGSDHTQTGAILGTPAYMSPEQAGGQKKVGSRSDVYALGAMLYEMLAGLPPFRGVTVADTLQQVLHDEPLPPRRLVPKLARDLDTICLKCLEKDASKRYASAELLAEDLRRFREGEPIRARPISVIGRGIKWARRRPGAAAAVCALAVLMVGLMAATALLTAANERERSARQLAEHEEAEAKTQRDKSRDRFLQIGEAVDRFHIQVSESPEMKAQGTEALRTRLLETAAEFYEKFVQEPEGNDPRIQAARGTAYWRLGELYQATGKLPQAEQSYRQALTIQKELAPYDSQRRYERAVTERSLGSLLERTGRKEEAEKSFTEALDILEALVAASPSAVDFRNELAQTLKSMAQLYRADGRTAKAEEAYRRVIALQRELAVKHPSEARYASQLASSQNRLGYLFSQTGRNKEAEEAFQAALAVQLKLTADHPDNVDYWDDLARNYNNLAIDYSKTGRLKQAEKAYQEALTIRLRIAVDHPTVPQHQAQLARAHNQMASMFAGTRRRQEAEQGYQQALAIRQKLARNDPNVVQYQNDLALTLNELGRFFHADRRYREAEQVFEQALAIRQKLAAAYPAINEYQQRLAHTSTRLGVLYRRTNRFAEAEAVYEQALAIQERLALQHPEDTANRIGQADTLFALGTIYALQGRPEEAEAAYRQVLALRKELAAAEPDVPSHPSVLADTQGELQLLYKNRGLTELADRASEERYVLRQRLAVQYPDVPVYLSELSRIEWERAGRMHTTGRFEEAEEAYRLALTLRKKLVADWPDTPAYRNELAETLNNLAVLYSSIGRRSETLPLYQEALAVRQRLVDMEPDNTGYQASLAQTQHNIGIEFNSAGNYKDAEKPYRQAVDIRQNLVNSQTVNQEYRNLLAQSQNNLGVVYSNQGRRKDALHWYQEALVHRKALAGDRPQSTEYQTALATTYYNIGLESYFTGRYKEAEQAFQNALAIRQKQKGSDLVVARICTDLGNLQALGGRNSDAFNFYNRAVQTAKAFIEREGETIQARRLLCDSLTGRANTEGKLGRNPEAVADLDRALELDSAANRSFLQIYRAIAVARSGDHAAAAATLARFEKQPLSGKELYRMASVTTQAARAALKDAKLAKEQRQKLSRQYAAGALEFLKRAEADGYFKSQSAVAIMKSDADLDPLRDRADFQKWLEALTGTAAKP